MTQLEFSQLVIQLMNSSQKLDVDDAIREAKKIRDAFLR